MENKLFKKNLEKWKQSRLASIYNKELQLKDRYDKEFKDLEKEKEKIINATFLPIGEGAYYDFN